VVYVKIIQIMLSFFYITGEPRISLSLGPSYVQINNNVTLPKCHVTSFPPAMVTWFKVGGGLSKARATMRDGEMSLMNVQKQDSGLYECKASNNLRQVSALTQLVVVKMPQFTISLPREVKVNKNRNLTVSCQATGDPQPTVTWMKENGELPYGRSKVGEDGKIQIWNVKVEDSGIYTCIASSAEVFKAFSVMKLTVIKSESKIKRV